MRYLARGDFDERRPATRAGVRGFASKQISEKFSDRLRRKRSTRAPGRATGARTRKRFTRVIGIASTELTRTREPQNVADEVLNLGGIQPNRDPFDAKEIPPERFNRKSVVRQKSKAFTQIRGGNGIQFKRYSQQQSLAFRLSFPVLRKKAFKPDAFRRRLAIEEDKTTSGFENRIAPIKRSDQCPPGNSRRRFGSPLRRRLRTCSDRGTNRRRRDRRRIGFGE